MSAALLLAISMCSRNSSPSDARPQIRPAVFDPLMLGPQEFNGLAVDSEEMACQIGGEPLQGIAADDVFGDHTRRLPWLCDGFDC